MSIRRQGFMWEVEDLGNLPPKRLDSLTEAQSIFISGIGNATIRNRLRTKEDEFLVIQFFGSTPGIYGYPNNTGDNWVPGGYVNFVIDTTEYFQTPDGRPYSGLSGTGSPFPITTSFGPTMKNFIPIEIPPDTNWDITYMISNAMVEPIEDFPCDNIVEWTLIGI